MRARKRGTGLFRASRDELSGYAKQISSHWQSVTDSIITVAKICAEANQRLSSNEKTELIEKLPFGRSVFSKLAAIGSDTRLHKPRVIALLPPSYSTIYEVTQLSNAKLSEAVRSSVLQPKVKRTELVSFARSGTASSKKKTRKVDVTLPFFAEIRFPANTSRDLLHRFNKFLVQLSEEANAEITRSVDLPAYNRLVSRIERAIAKREIRVTMKMKSLLREHIAERKKLTKEQGKKWVFASDELDLNVLPHELDERIKLVLGTLGNEGDYPQLRDRAEALVDSSVINTATQQLENMFPFAEYTEVNATEEMLREHRKSRRKRDFSQLIVK